VLGSQFLAARGLGAQRTATPNDPLAEIFNRTMERRASLRSVQARFTETTVSSLLEEPLVAHGTVIGAPPARVRMTYTDPVKKIITLDGRSLTIVWPDRHERESIDISQTQKRIDQYFTQASLSRLRSMFEIAVQPPGPGRPDHRIEMKPTRKQIKEGLERLELRIDSDTLLLTQMQMTFAGGDTKTIRLENVVVNVPIDDDMFRGQP
jgi:outer membrane lipoprotein-sorting protein